MRRTAKALGLILTVVLVLSISTQLINFSSVSGAVDAASQVALDSGAYELVTHKMSTAEFQAYQDSVEATRDSSTTGRYGTGLTAPKGYEWSDIAENGYIVEAITNQATPPAAVDFSLSPYFPPIGDQASQGSCASFAVGYYCKTFQEAKEHNWDLSGARWTGGNDDGNVTAAYQSKVMSPAFLYNLINPGMDVGSNFETPIRLVSNVGICSWEKMPYYWQDYTRWPTEDAWAEAPMYRVNSTYSYQYLYANTTQGIESLKNWLAAGNLAIVGIDAIDNLWNYTGKKIALNSQDLMTTDTYVFSGLNHAATVVGYDDLFTYVENGTVQHGAVKIANTWGKGSWENIPDGCYWISYAAFKNMIKPDNPVVLFQDQTGYQPQILASFNITHPYRGDCNITFGYGTPNAPIATKNFSDFIRGGNHSFCPNNIIFDLTDFQSYLTGQYNQPFYMQVFDKEGDNTIGTVNYFAVANSASNQAPLSTVNGQNITLTLNAYLAPASLSISAPSGPALKELTLSGVGFSGSHVDISYYDPITGQWASIVSDYGINTNFTYTLQASDLQQANAAGDNPAGFDTIVFRVADGMSTVNASYIEMRRGLSQIGNQTAARLLGDGTDLSGTVFAQNGQAFTVAGRWFKQGYATIHWDNLMIGNVTVDENGSFSASATVPTTAAGKHTVTVSDGAVNVTATITRLPTVTSSYTDVWHASDFTVNLTADYAVTETYYKINSGATQNVSVSGFPVIATEGANNTLEYWSTWNVYGTGSMELAHATISGLKLDKTAPTATLQINGGAASTTSAAVTLSLNAADTTSGIAQVRFSNDAAFAQATWEPFSSSKTWSLLSGLGQKTVYCQVMDNAGQIATVSSQITLAAQPTATPTPPTPTPTQTAIPTPTPTATATASPAPTPTVPEVSIQLLILLLAVVAAATLITLRTKKQ
ncbi:C1 family peptidase [Candidatus Bathyarchaeota archaeon]|nr:C1 family peptidase [Candidatus Bathyarchaeota archaeon]